MDPGALAKQTAIVIAQAIVLYMLSRLLFVWVLQALASRNPRAAGGRLVQVVRLPGNFIHELSHAAGYLLCGYTVQRIVPCVFDPLGRGSCQPGRPWLPLAVPWLATGAAAIAPLLVGTFVLRGAAQVFGIQLQVAADAQANLGDVLVNNIWANLQALDLHGWQTYLFLYLAFSIGSELSPSRVDLQRSIPALLALGAALVAVFIALQRVPPEAPVYHFITGHMAGALTSLQALLDFGILTTALVAAVMIVPGLLIRAVRR